MVPMEASTLYFFRNERDPRMHKIALRRREKLNFVLMYVIISEYESSVFSLSLVAILFITFAADGLMFFIVCIRHVASVQFV